MSATPIVRAAMADAVGTDERLLSVAERLFAAHGIDAVSVRSITIEAEANIASVHYHFGTKVDLVRALVERRIGEVNSVRARMLRDLDRAPQVTARDIATVWVEPLANLARDPQRRAYLGFLEALSHTGDMQKVASEIFRPHYPRIDAALARALPHVAAPVRRMRFGMATALAMHALADLHRLAGPWRNAHEPVTDDELVACIIDAATGLLEGGGSPIDSPPTNSRAKRARS